MPGSFSGSPPYLAPEQAEGRLRDIGPAADVYGLGAILYELLTRRAPFAGDSRLDLLRQVVADDPPAPRLLRPGLPRDLETICLMCLRKRPEGRYASAAALAEDLENYLAGRPIKARRAGAVERLWRRARRRPAEAALAAVCALAAVGLVGAGLWRDAVLAEHNRELSAALADARASARLAERHLDASRLRAARRALDGGDPIYAQEALAELRIRPDGGDLRGFAWGWLRRQARRDAALLWAHESGIRCMALGPDGRTLAVGDGLGTVIVGEIDGLRPPMRIVCHAGPVEALAFSPDGGLLATSESDRPEVRLWDRGTGRRLAEVECPAGARAVMPGFFANGRRLVAHIEGAGLRESYLYEVFNDPPSLRLTHRYPTSSRPGFDPTGRFLAAPAAGGKLDLIDAAKGETIRTFHESAGPWFPAFSTDGRRLAAMLVRELIVWDIPDGNVFARRRAEDSRDQPSVLSADGSVVAHVCHENGAVQVFDLRRDRDRAIAPDDLPRDNRSTHPILSPDGETLVTAAWGRPNGAAPLKAWDIGTGRGRELLGGRPIGAERLAFAPDGRSALVADGRLVLRCRLDPPADADPTPRRDHGGKWVWSTAFAPDGRIASGGDDSRIVLRDLAGSAPPLALEGHTEAVDAPAFSPDGSTLASGSQEPSNNLKLWDLAAGRERVTLAGHADKVRWVAFNRDGSALASAAWDDTARTWDARTGRPLRTFRGHTDRVHQAIFSPDGRTLAGAGADGLVRLWDPLTGEELTTLRGHSAQVNALAFAPDGSTLASGSHDGTLRLWRAGDEP